MRVLDRLDAKVLGPKGRPATAVRRRVWAALFVALVLAVVVAGFVAHGWDNPAFGPLTGAAIGVLVGRHYVGARRRRR